MTREEAIKVLNTYDVNFYEYTAEEIVDAIEMAIEALQNKSRPFGDCSKCIHTYGTLGCCTTVSNEWVYDCEHGMEQYKNTKAEPSDDGTLEVKVEDATKIGRVLISDDKHRGGLYYPDEDEPQSISFENDTEIKSCSKDSDLISRADAIRVVEKNSYRMAGLTELKLKIEMEALPSADRPKGEWIEETSWKYKRGGRNSDMKEILGTEWMTMIRQRCSECNKVTMVDGSILYKYCPHCGSDNRERSEE